jgi:hypothetical protein
MKKALILSIILLTGIAIVPSVEAKSTGTKIEPQIRIQLGGGRRNRRGGRVRTTTTTRIVGFGRNRVRETIRTTYMPNGRTRTEVISRERIRG